MPCLRVLGDLLDLPADEVNFDASRQMLDRLVDLLKHDAWDIEVFSGRKPYGYAEFECARSSGIVRAGDSPESLARIIFDWMNDLARGERGCELHLDGLIFGNARWEVSMRYPRS